MNSRRTTAGPVRRGQTRVAIVVPRYPPQVGGIERYAERLAQTLHASERHEAVVICANDSRSTRVENRDGVLVVRLGTRWTISNTPVNPSWLWQVGRLLKRLDIDIVSAHAPVPFLPDIVALLNRSRPVVMTYHSGSMLKGRSGVDTVLKIYEKYVLPAVFRRCKGLVAVSPISMTHRYQGARIIPGGVDTQQFSPADEDLDRDPLILYVGRVERNSRWKGVDVLIDAMATIIAEVPAARLEVVGSGDWIPELEERAEALNVAGHIVWRGNLHGDDLTAAYRRSALVALPSVTESEALGLVLIEAMACGRPVVGSDVGGIPFSVRDNVNGFLVPAGDAKALAGACLNVLRDPRLSDVLGKAGRVDAVERWESAGQMAKMIDFLDELVQR